SAFVTAVVFSLLVSVLVFVFAEPLMLVFVRPDETEIIAVGVTYLRIEGAFYCGIGVLFLLYGYYRAIRMPGMSVVLTILSLGTRVVLSYWLASMPEIGVTGIWWSIPIGWLIADVVGIWYYRYKKFRFQESKA
ncbi:MATE family efflux transporter, partial [uncultured Bacteroides sp.]